MAESNLKEMMIDDYYEDDNEDSSAKKDNSRLEWYLIDTERNFCKVWNFLICWITIYNLIMTPFLMTFPDVYQRYDEEN